MLLSKIGLKFWGLTTQNYSLKKRERERQTDRENPRKTENSNQTEDFLKKHHVLSFPQTAWHQALNWVIIINANDCLVVTDGTLKQVKVMLCEQEFLPVSSET